MDLANARIALDKYRSTRTGNPDNTAALAELNSSLSVCGFTSIEAFFTEVSDLKNVKYNPANIFASQIAVVDRLSDGALAKIKADGINTLYYFFPQAPVIFLPVDYKGTINTTLCTQRGITVSRDNPTPSVIMHGKGTLTVRGFFNVKTPLDNRIFQSLVYKLLQDNSITSTIDNNDLLVNGKKVFGSRSFTIDGIQCFRFFVNFNLDTTPFKGIFPTDELLNQIGTLGLTQAQVKTALSNAFKNYLGFEGIK
jgi:hypothetical protein